MVDPVDPFKESATGRAALEILSNANGHRPRKRKRYPSEDRRVKATYDLASDPVIREEVKELSARYDVTTGRVVCALLRFALDGIERGEIKADELISRE